MDLQEYDKRVKTKFLSDCDDREKCIHQEVFYQYGEWKHLVRSAIEHLKEKAQNSVQ